MRGYDISDMVGHFAKVVDPAHSVTCAGSTQADSTPYLSLRLDSDGSAIISYQPPRVSMLVDEACLADGLNIACGDVMQCHAAGCDTCACNLAARSPTLSMNATYTQDRASIAIAGSTFEFCVLDDVLRVRDIADHAKYELELDVQAEPHCAGTPAACNVNKLEKDCSLVAGCKSLGSCSDEKAQCPGMTESDKCISAGCTWFFTGCGGEPEGPCDAISVDWCRLTPGCRVEN